MGRKKAGWIGTGIILLVVLFVVFAPAEEEKPGQQKETAVFETEKEIREDKIPAASKEQTIEEADLFQEPEEIPEEETENADTFLPKGILLLEENFDHADQTFGFDGALVKNGALLLTEHMRSSQTSVKKFDHMIMGQSYVEISFDWKWENATEKGECGLEFRDLYGRLIFAVAGGYHEKTGRFELKFSASGLASNSSNITSVPKWRSVSCNPDAVYQISFRADFVSKKVSALILDENGNRIAKMKDTDISASGLAKMTAACYSAGAAELIDNFKLYGPDDAGSFPLEDKKVIAFGDSIVDGHLYKEAGFVEFLAEKEGLVLEYNYANNGARIMPGSTVNPNDGLGGTILDCQVNQAAEDHRDPDYIIFDGGANDAYSNIIPVLGTVNDAGTSTFAGAFRNTIRAMHRYWPKAKIIYVAIHKLSVRDTYIQEEMRKLTLAICADMGVEVADLYTRGWDTTDAALNQKYTFDVLNASQIPVAEKNSTGVHPNFLAIEELYVPVVSDALKRAKEVTIGFLAPEKEEEIGLDSVQKEQTQMEGARQVNSIKFASLKYQIAAGKKITLVPKIAPSDAADQRVKFEITSNEKYASIDTFQNECEVTTKKSGAGKTITLLARASDGSGTEREVQILLMKHAVTMVDIENSTQSLAAGKKTLLKASVKTNGKKANKKLVWTSSEKGFVTLKQNKDGSQCMITAKPAGAGKTVTITAKSTDGTEKFDEIVLKIE